MKTASMLAAAAALFLAACGNGQRVEEPIRPVVTMTVTPGAHSTRDVYSGEMRARIESDLAFRIAGKLAARLVDAGAQVHRGQALARLDPEDARLSAESARAQQASAESDFALAKAELERSADLLARKFISQSAFDARQSAFNSARARLDQARSQAAIADNQKEYTTLVADADGVVVSTAAEPGQVVAAGQSILRLARAGEMEVVINAPEGQIARFRAGQEVSVSLWADPGAVFPGRVREIAGGADPVTRTFTVRVAVPKVPANAHVGMTANVLFRPEEIATLIVVPLTALDREREQASVWVVDAKTSRVQRRPVTLGQLREDGATVLSGLVAGDIVVTAGVHKLRPEQTVRLAGRASLSMPAPATAAR